MARIQGLMGPIRVGNRIGSAWAGRITFPSGGTSDAITVGAGYTHIFRASGNMLLFPQNSTAAHLVAGANTLASQTGVYAQMTNASTVTIVHPAGQGAFTGNAVFYFVVVDGGTNMTLA